MQLIFGKPAVGSSKSQFPSGRAKDVWRKPALLPLRKHDRHWDGECIVLRRRRCVPAASLVSTEPQSVLSRRPTNQRTTAVNELTVAEATENIYASLRADNADIDAHIATLKAALSREGKKQAVFDPARLVQNNRAGRKLMQAYFRQRGVSVSFSE
ncbi:hypothetical protein ABID26_006434 [Mesorhizobium shonense]|uniref:Uncharacterized protein n=1 Tax=Mesorhizobium shonense TaxID=1209948 RepID=A0ABV2I267_9HYPH